MKTLVIDNYDSFTYNLVHYLEDILQEKVDVYRNDKISIADVNQYENILISPGPGIPEEAGITKELIKTYGPTKRILGVCLGHQAIGEVYGSKLSNLEKVYHGMGTPIEITVPEDPLFENLPRRFEGGRYHSWIIDENNCPDPLEITAKDDQGRIMAVRHREYRVHGVQFHPESVLTLHGMDIMKNWINHC